MQTDNIEKMAVRQIVLEALLMATLVQVGRADFKTFSTTDWGAFLDNIRVQTIGRLEREGLSNGTHTVGLTYADNLLSAFAEMLRSKQ
jgi:hypothetical protein